MTDLYLLESIVNSHLDGRERAEPHREGLSTSVWCHHHCTVKLDLGRGAGHSGLAEEVRQAGGLSVLRNSNLIDRPNSLAIAKAGVQCLAYVYSKAQRQDLLDWVNKAPEHDAMHPSNWIVFDHSADKIEHLMHYWPSAVGASPDFFTYIFLQ